jgi:hypothetical protein
MNKICPWNNTNNKTQLLPKVLPYAIIFAILLKWISGCIQRMYESQILYPICLILSMVYLLDRCADSAGKELPL